MPPVYPLTSISRFARFFVIRMGRTKNLSLWSFSDLKEGVGGYPKKNSKVGVAYLLIEILTSKVKHISSIFSETGKRNVAIFFPKILDRQGILSFKRHQKLSLGRVRNKSPQILPFGLQRAGLLYKYVR